MSENCIETINGNKLAALSSVSAGTAQIAVTDISGNSLVSKMDSTKLEFRGDAITGYDGSAFAGAGGKTYEGTAPIVVNNDTNVISADTLDVTYQQLTVDDSLVTTSNSAMIAFGVNTTWLTAYLVEQGFVKN